jgi:hypothetical protein
MVSNYLELLFLDPVPKALTHYKYSSCITSLSNFSGQYFHFRYNALLRVRFRTKYIHFSKFLPSIELETIAEECVGSEEPNNVPSTKNLNIDRPSCTQTRECYHTTWFQTASPTSEPSNSL